MGQENGANGGKKGGSAKPNSSLAAYAIYGAAGVQLAVAVVAGLAFGNYLDRRLNTLPWLTIACTILGFAGGMVNLVRMIEGFAKLKDRR